MSKLCEVHFCGVSVTQTDRQTDRHKSASTCPTSCLCRADVGFLVGGPQDVSTPLPKHAHFTALLNTADWQLSHPVTVSSINAIQ